MLNSTRNKDIRTLGYVLKRTNYGEADRILQIITPIGKISAIAKGVRKEKSKLAGGVEIFTLSDFNIYIGKSELGVITGAKMIKHYGEIVKNMSRMELAAMILKRIGAAAEHSDSPEFFRIIDQGLAAIDRDEELQMVEAWCLLNLKKAIGEDINLYRDVDGGKLAVDEKYNWNAMEGAFARNEDGKYGANEIKLLRLIVSNDYEVVSRVKMDNELMCRVLQLARMVI